MEVLSCWLLTAARVAIHLPTGTAVVADLHLGYAQARQRRGEAVPGVELPQLLAPLGDVLARHGVRRLVVAGDLFQAGLQADLVEQLLAWLECQGVELHGVVPGNHDRGLTAFSAGEKRLPVFPEGVVLGSWRVVHGDGPLPGGPVVQGHEHPSLSWGGIRLPCYLVGPERLILPAYSADAAGGNVLRDRRWHGHRCLAIGDEVVDLGVLGRMPRG